MNHLAVPVAVTDAIALDIDSTGVVTRGLRLDSDEVTISVNDLLTLPSTVRLRLLGLLDFLFDLLGERKNSRLGGHLTGEIRTQRCVVVKALANLELVSDQILVLRSTVAKLGGNIMQRLALELEVIRKLSLQFIPDLSSSSIHHVEILTGF